jgi:hypothetical protein
MNLGDLINVFRQRSFDTKDPQLWSDDELAEFADDAEAEAAERARLIRDSTTEAICQIIVGANTAAYLLDPRILSVERAKLDSVAVPLALSSTPAMDQNMGNRPRDWRSFSGNWAGGIGGGWEDRQGTPSIAVLDAEGAGWKLTLSPRPTKADVLRLQVFRLPLQPLSTDGDNVPEIPPRLHVRLVDWMMYRAYSKQDAETFDAGIAAKHEAIFTAAFGPKIDANTRRKQEDRTSSVVQFREF